MKMQRRISPLSVVIGLSVILRVAASLYLGDHVEALPGTADQVSYHALALRVLEGHGFTFAENWWPATEAGEPTAHWSYLYTLYLVVIYWVFGPHPLAARLIQAVAVGIAHPLLAYKIAELVQPRQTDEDPMFADGSSSTPLSVLSKWWAHLNGGDLSIPLLAAALTAVYAYFVYYAGTLMTEPFFITAVLTTVYLTLRLGRASTANRGGSTGLALGLAMATAVLLRQLFLLIVPLVLVWLAVVVYRAHNSIRTIVAPTVVSLAVLCLAIIPATLFNYGRFDRFLLLNTNAGFAFYLSNHPVYGTQFVPASDMDQGYHAMIPDQLRSLNEAELDAELLERGLQFVIEDPVRYVRLSMSRIPLYFEFLPDPDSSTLSNAARLSSFGLFLPFMILGLVSGFVRDRGRGVSPTGFPRSGLGLLYLFILSYSGIHILSWVQIRYRLPVDAILIVFAAFGLHLTVRGLVDLLVEKHPFTQRSLHRT